MPKIVLAYGEPEKAQYVYETKERSTLNMNSIPRKDDLISVGPGKKLEYFVVEQVQFRISKRLDDLKEKGPAIVFVRKTDAY